MRTTKAQISLRIRAVWSAHLLFAAKTEWYLLFIYPKFQDSSRSLYLSLQVSLCLAWSETPEDTFSHSVAQMQYRSMNVAAPVPIGYYKPDPWL